MDSALVVTWKNPLPGREKMALDYAVEVSEHWGKLAADGRCSPPEMFFFPDGTGMWMVKGDRLTLEELMYAEESQHLTRKGQLLLEAFAWSFAMTGRAGEEYLLNWAATAQELAIF